MWGTIINNSVVDLIVISQPRSDGTLESLTMARGLGRCRRGPRLLLVVMVMSMGPGRRVMLVMGVGMGMVGMRRVVVGMRRVLLLIVSRLMRGRCLLSLALRCIVHRLDVGFRSSITRSRRLSRSRIRSNATMWRIVVGIGVRVGRR